MRPISAIVLTFCSLMLCLPTHLIAQSRTCGTMPHLEKQLERNPRMLFRMDLIEQNTLRLGVGDILRVKGRVDIPVVVHVVYGSSVENISDAQIRSQLRVLNADFNRENTDASRTDPRFADLAAATGIHFQLATRDPDGNPTTGITRTETSIRAFYSADNGVKSNATGGIEAWPTDQYLNIWVCKLGLGLLGYAQFPGGEVSTDGVVIDYRYFGTMNTVSAPFDRGRTTTHEVGHWLNLRHIWGDGGCEKDDHVDDTPPADEPHHGCWDAAVSCGAPVIVQNFMDYTDDACMNMFTRGQADRMLALFVPGGARHRILSSSGLDRPDPTEPLISYIPPRGLRAESLERGRFRLSWEPVEGAEAYMVRFRPEGEAEWSSRQFDRTYVNMSRLRDCQTYEFQVESAFADRSSGFSESYRFQTEGCGSTPVNNPGSSPYQASGLTAHTISDRSATLRWNRVIGARQYTLQYKRAGTKRIITKVVDANETGIYGLSSASAYLLRVRAELADGSGPWSDVTRFNTPKGDDGRIDFARAAETLLTIFSDATRGMAEIEHSLPEAGRYQVEIRHPGGRLAQRFSARMIRPGVPLLLELGRLPAGDYELWLEDADGFSLQQRFAYGG